MDIDTGTAVGDRGTILRTEDGGANWTRQGSGTSLPLLGVSFVDAKIGATVSGFCGAEQCHGYFWRTTDGGDTWTRRDSGSPYLAVFFVDAKIGMIVGGGSLQPSIIRRTTDGGDTWRGQAGSGGPFFVDANTGTTVGRGATILHTNTGGD